ncbi:MAG: restriction endonuclease [archaeon]
MGDLFYLMPIFVKKLDGSLEPYDEAKLCRSLEKAGASRQTIGVVLEKSKKILFDGIETRRLFNFVLKEYRNLEPDSSPKYNLKAAIMHLGKEGYLFEKFVSKIFEKKGYFVELNREVEGQFVSHEIDVSAGKGKEMVMVECKYHRNPWLGCNIQTALYVYARFLDVQRLFNKAMLVTNTKFSTQVVKYSKGVGLGLMGWQCPGGDSLEFNIERFRLYPVTILYQLPQRIIDKCLENEIILLSDMASFSAEELSSLLGLSKGRAQEILQHANFLLS